MSKSDEGTSGLDKYGLVNSNTETYNSKTTGTQSDTRGITWYCFVIDKAGNKGTNNTGNFKVDTKSPTCRVNKDGTSGSNGWYKGRKVDLSLETNDPGAENSGVENYTLTTSTTASYNKKDSASQDNTTGVKWYGYVRDNAGNTGKCNSGNFKVDRSSPTCRIDSYGYRCSTGGESARVGCSENGPSGLNKCAGASGSSSTKTGLKGNVTYTVTDKIGRAHV